MEKINFEDLPSTETPINAENLNKLQENVNQSIIEEDFIEDVTFYEEAVKEHCSFIKKGNMIFISYQGEAKVHVKTENLFSVPEKYIPKNEQAFATCIINSYAYGEVVMESDGILKLSQISETTYNGRIYFQMFYLLKQEENTENI